MPRKREVYPGYSDRVPEVYLCYDESGTLLCVPDRWCAGRLVDQCW